MNQNTRQAKQEIVAEIKQKIQNCKSFVVLDYKGLTVKADTELRNEFRKTNVDYHVLKNTMLRIALNELGYTEFDKALNGPTAIAFANGEALDSAKISYDNIKKLNKMAIKCGMFEKKFADAETVNQLATVPSRQVLLGMLANVLVSPISGLAIALKGIADKQQA